VYRIENTFLLLPLPPLLWLISGVLFRGRGQTPTFWALAVLSAAAEPLLQGTTGKVVNSYIARIQ
jgi:hypothetical protein